MTTVIADSSQEQMDLMNEGYVDGLVGQLPLIIGHLSFQVLMNITEGKQLSKEYYGTHLLEVLRAPLQLPPVQMNYNYIGGFAALAYTFFTVVALLSIALLYWTYVNRNTRTLRASQPVFMAMLCGGSLMMASAMIPLSITDENFSQKGADVACMSIPWLLTIGFCTIFSALFTKTWRIVRILENAARFQRVKITVREVMYPYVSLLAANIIILTSWSVINPLVYERTNNIGTDGWNRIISSYGHCVSSNRDAAAASAPYLGSLAAVNGGILGLANIMAYRARNISTEFGESQYISIVMSSMLQAFMIGGPLIFFVFNQPLAYFIVVLFLDFAVCMATLLFMFVPKILAHRELSRKKESNPKRADTDNSSTTHDSQHRRPFGGSARHMSTFSWFVRNMNHSFSFGRDNFIFRWMQQSPHEDKPVGSLRSAEHPIDLTRSVQAGNTPETKENSVTWDVKVDNTTVTENAVKFPWDVKLATSSIINRFQGDDIVKLDNDKNVDGDKDGGLKLQSNTSDSILAADFKLSSDGESDTARFSNFAMEDEFFRWIEGLPGKHQITLFLSFYEKFVADKGDFQVRKVE
jgi:hypothetical protein